MFGVPVKRVWFPPLLLTPLWTLPCPSLLAILVPDLYVCGPLCGNICYLELSFHVFISFFFPLWTESFCVTRAVSSGASSQPEGCVM